VTWILISIFILLLLALVLPWGVRFVRQDGVSRIFVIVAAIPIRLPKMPAQTIKMRAAQSEPIQHAELRHDDENLFDNTADVFEWIELISEIGWSRLFAAVRSGVQGVRVRVHKFEVTIATPDPALTGMLYGLSFATAGMAPRFLSGIDCDFTAARPRANLKVDVVVIPLKLALTAVRVLRTLPLQRIFHKLRRMQTDNRKGDPQ
jgi:hypothetical protein